MPEPFKNFFNPDLIAQMGGHLARVAPDFDAARFVALATDGLEPLELKARSVHIRDALAAVLPADFEAACAVMVAALHPQTARESGNEMDGRGIAGWAVMPMADYVATHGLEDVALSLGVLREMTQRFTAEFAVRPFFIAAEAQTLRVFSDWAEDANFHVRRLASEGSRPRLPWGLRLQSFVADPAPLLPILEALRDDERDYVRRSVANNLNDIAKDHPDLVARLAGDWLENASKDRVRLVKHACRSLIKDGHAGALQALGYGPAQVEVRDLAVKTPAVVLGGAVEFEAVLVSTVDREQPLIVDYVIHYRKANGSSSGKVFKWKVMALKPGANVRLAKRHAIKPITTRVHYPGAHAVEVQVNGQSFGQVAFDLEIPGK